MVWYGMPCPQAMVASCHCIVPTPPTSRWGAAITATITANTVWWGRVAWLHQACVMVMFEVDTSNLIIKLYKLLQTYVSQKFSVLCTNKSILCVISISVYKPVLKLNPWNLGGRYGAEMLDGMVSYGGAMLGVWYHMVWYGMLRYGMVWYGMVWYGMVWYGMVWFGMVWYGTSLHAPFS